MSLDIIILMDNILTRGSLPPLLLAVPLMTLLCLLKIFVPLHVYRDNSAALDDP